MIGILVICLIIIIFTLYNKSNKIEKFSFKFKNKKLKKQAKDEQEKAKKQETDWGTKTDDLNKGKGSKAKIDWGTKTKKQPDWKKIAEKFQKKVDKAVDKGSKSKTDEKKKDEKKKDEKKEDEKKKDKKKEDEKKKDEKKKEQTGINSCSNASNDKARKKMWDDHDDEGCKRLTSEGEQYCTERYIWDTNRGEYVYCQWDDDEGCKYKDTCVEGDSGDSSSSSEDESSDDEYECPNAPNDEARKKMYEDHDDKGCKRLTNEGDKCTKRYIWDTNRGEYVYCQWDDDECEYKDTCEEGDNGDSSSSSEDESSDDDDCPNAPNDEARKKMYEDHRDKGCKRLTNQGNKCTERYIWDTERNEYVYCQWDDDECIYKDTCDVEDDGNDGNDVISTSSNKKSTTQDCDYSNMMSTSDHNSLLNDAIMTEKSKERIACNQDISVDSPVCDTYTQVQYPNSYSAAQIMGSDYDIPGRISYAPCEHNKFIQQIGHAGH